jgi:hypothetical protein
MKLFRLFTALTLVCFALSPEAHAVVPTPDGGYPGQNTAEGQSALLHLTTGTYNTAVGWSSLGFLTTGTLNTGIGAAALLENTGDQNTATGAGALLGNTNGTQNTANGALALFNNTIGAGNTAIGAAALEDNIIGDGHTAVGSGALMNLHGNHGGSPNTAVGGNALAADFNGVGNTAVGYAALLACTGDGNTAVGLAAGSALTTGYSNIILGVSAGDGITTAHDTICIGPGTAGNNVDNACYIDNIFSSTSSGGTAVFVNTNGRLGTSTSSRRFKKDIKPMDHASEPLFSFKPVTFRYKKGIDPEDPEHKSEFGLVAEDVEKVNPDLVVRDKTGKPYSVRYDQVDTMLLNEFLKEHKRVEEQQATIAELEGDAARQEKISAQQQKQIAALTAAMKEQAAQIQRVSAQLELTKPASHTVLNSQ